MNKVDWWESWLMRKSIDEKVDWWESQLMRKSIDEKVDWWESQLMRKLIVSIDLHGGRTASMIFL